MATISNILVIVDPTAQEHPAVEKAARIAEKYRSRLELYVCDTKEAHALRYAAHLQQGSGDFISHVRALLEDIAQPLRTRGIDTCIEVERGDPLHTMLLARTRRTSADLVVKETHHHSLAKRTFITNTDWHLIRGCPVPLLLTKSRPWSAAPVLAAALDPGHVNDKPALLDNRILDWSRSLRDQLGGTLHAIHAFLPLILTADGAGGILPMMSSITPQVIETERVQSVAQLESLVAPYAIDSKHVHVRLGVASDVLPRFAEEIGADVMVMGAISRSGLQRIFIGSTAERVLESLPGDVLVIKPPDFAADLPF